MNSSATPRWVDYVTMPLLYFAAAKASAYFSMGPQESSIFMAQAAVLMAALLIFNGRGYYQWLMLALAAECLAGWSNQTLPVSLTLGLSNLFLAILAFTLLGRMRFNRSLNQVSDVTKFAVGAVLVAACIEAIVDTVFRAELIGLEISYLQSIRNIWFANALGLMLLSPVLFAFWRPVAQVSPISFKPLQSDYLVAVIAAVLAAVLLKADDSRIFGMHVGPILLLPLILYTAVRRDLRFTSISLLSLGLLTTYLTMSWSNPFGVSSQGDMIIAAQEFLSIAGVIALGISALITQIRHQQFGLEQVNKELTHCNNCLELRLEKDSSKLESISHELERMTLTDQTTELPNWRGFLDVAIHELSRSQRHKEPVCLLSLDIDHFRAINDEHGHQGGDEILKQIGHVISELVRSCDIAARFGGEEFIILAPNTNLDQARIFAERLRKGIQDAALRYRQADVKVTTSIGIALHRNGENLDKLSHRAEKCLESAKRSGRNRAVDERHDQEQSEDSWRKSPTDMLRDYGQPI